MAQAIPIRFEHKGKVYQAVLSPVNGAGGGIWFLMINHYFRGQLMLHAGNGRFGSNEGTFEDLSQFFADHVMLYPQ